MLNTETRIALLDYIRPRFKLDWGGAHGISHWERVEANGLALAGETGANPLVVSLFALVLVVKLVVPDTKNLTLSQRRRWKKK